ncbi:DUF1642 domain-containing protein [Listeria fleischmannii]|uniref:DUF1642 domain-containing protein n=1 Tax=Listeria fleischmannii TaxID=1069827 RepID=UPI000254F9B7|nr:DUF1642 domain-containing protein [Listeria fleischmannii]EIA21387.1 phage protein, putative [Listeria fleischmannii subsp. coloradonensis]STY35289.1 Protein of uncharacterised function (DUF1642) [Listeria fleischmannii subsp. coloradonensis]
MQLTEKFIAVNTREKFDKAVEEVDEKGYRWLNRNYDIAHMEVWEDYKENTVIHLWDNGDVTLINRTDCLEKYPDIKIVDYEIKPKFKVGDRVQQKVYGWEGVVKRVRDNGSFGINDYQAWYYPNHFELIESPKKPTVPKCFDEWCRMNHVPSDSAVRDFCKLIHEYYKGTLNSDLEEWLGENPETALKALQNGYEVEEEPLYYVKLPGTVTPYLHQYVEDGNVHFLNARHEHIDLLKFKFTESEIKAIDPWYWKLAAPVEEDK